MGQYAHLFDPIQKKLYRQPLLTEAQLASAFGDDFSLINASNISAATDLFPAYHFQSATVAAGPLRLVTSDGVILSMDQNGHANLMGMNQSWQAAYAGAALIPDIEKLVLTENMEARRNTRLTRKCDPNVLPTLGQKDHSSHRSYR